MDIDTPLSEQMQGNTGPSIRDTLVSLLTLDEDMARTLLCDPYTFDTDKNKGRRKFSESTEYVHQFLQSNGVNKTGFQKSIAVMTHYLATHTFGTEKKDILDRQRIIFHLGQQYAMIGDYTHALPYFISLKNEHTTFVGTTYLEATIAFLQRDKDALTTIRENTKSSTDLGNKQFIDYLYTYFDTPYVVAYHGGKSLAEIYGYLLNEKFLESGNSG